MKILLIIFGILLFNFIIFAHEFGHFFWAKKFGVKVNEFALGMGPRLLKFKKGETVFSVRAFPIGGFCEMEGEDKESEGEGSLGSKKPWQRMVIVAFGAIMNIVVGFFMILIITFQMNKLPTTTIDSFSEKSVSSVCGLRENDQILKINGVKTNSAKEIFFGIGAYSDKEFEVQVKREGEVITLSNVRFPTVVTKNGDEVNIVDFKVKSEDKKFLNVIRYSCQETISIVKIVWRSLVGVITKKISIKNMSGPVGIVAQISDTTVAGLEISLIAALNNILIMMALITINLGVFNLLPLPALDGGRLVFLLSEMILGKKIDPKYEGFIHTAGFFLFIALMLWITYADIIRLIGLH